MNKVAISIGSNLERTKNIEKAVFNLERVFGSLLCSPVYVSDASGFMGPRFYNLVVVFESDMEVSILREQLRIIEITQGRKSKSNQVGSRTLDLDLLLYGDQVLYDIGFDVPRKEIFDHSYILKPLADILPNFCHPVTGERFLDSWMGYDLDQEPLICISEFKLP